MRLCKNCEHYYPELNANNSWCARNGVEISLVDGGLTLKHGLDPEIERAYKTIKGGIRCGKEGHLYTRRTLKTSFKRALRRLQK